MERDSLAVCPECAENCYRIHGKAGSRRGSYFFKVLLGDFAKTLRIPPAFVAQLRNRAHSDAILEGPSGQRWVVKLCCSSMGLNFQDGWSKFVSDNSLEIGDFLVFKHVCNSHFMVQIFGRSGCEKMNVFNVKHSTDVGKETVSCVPQMIILHAKEDLNGQVMASSNLKQSFAEASSSLACTVNENKPSCCGSDIHPLKSIDQAMPSFTGKKQKMLQLEKIGVKNYVQTYFVSCRQPVTQAERDKALKAATSFKSTKPSSFIVMKHSQVYQGFWLSFPQRCLRLFKLPKKRVEVTLLGPTNKEYAAAYLGDRKNAGLSGGWRYFALDNNLEEGDVCVFELVNKTKYIFKVHIFRVVEKRIPLKKMVGTRVSNENRKSIPAATNRFKMIKGGTNSEKDIAGNSAAEKNGNCFSNIRNHRKSAKQGFPIRFLKLFKLPKKRIEVTLLGPTNKEYGVSYLGDRSNSGLSGGWRYFALDNNLEEGDVCIFELVNKIKYIFKVYIFRVVEKRTPLQKMEGTRISKEATKSIPAATNNFKGTRGAGNSEKDIVCNLAAKKNVNCFSDIQEHGKSGKQVIKHAYKKRQHPISGSNNTVGGITIISDSNTGCGISVSYATGQNLVEHLKTSLALIEAPKSIPMEAGDLSSEPCISIVDINEEPALAVGLDVSSMAHDTS